jgi:hypothetical protein
VLCETFHKVANPGATAAKRGWIFGWKLAGLRNAPGGNRRRYLIIQTSGKIPAARGKPMAG